MSSVYLAAVIEYLTAEMMELSGNAAKDGKKKRITPRHIMLCVNFDDELNRLLKDRKVIIPGAGVVPFIHDVLLPPRPHQTESPTVAASAGKSGSTGETAC